MVALIWLQWESCLASSGAQCGPFSSIIWTGHNCLLGKISILSLVHSPGSLLGSTDWLPEENVDFLSVISHLHAFLQNPRGTLLRCTVW